jgi:hypothetical protein
MRSRQLTADSSQPLRPPKESKFEPCLKLSAVGSRLSAAAIVASALLSTAAPVLAAEPAAPLVQKYRQRCVELMPQGLKQGVHKIILGPDGWLLLKDELAYASTDRFWGIAALSLKPNVPMERVDAIAAIAAFRDDLARVGIELLFAPAPNRPMVVPEAVLGRGKVPPGRSTPRLQPVEEEFYAALRARGVESIDLTRVLLAHPQPEHGPLYVPGDSHWAGAAVVLAAQEIADWVKRRPWFASVEKQRFETSWTTVEHFGYLYKDLHERAGLEKRPPDTVQCRAVRAIGPDGKQVKIETRNPDAPVILIGDSQTIWWRSQEAALYQQLAAELGFKLDTLDTSGGGTNESRLNLVRTARATPGYLGGKKLVIWCFSSRSLLGHKDGWLRTPLDAPADNAGTVTAPPADAPAAKPPAAGG